MSEESEFEQPFKRQCFYLKRLQPSNGEHSIIPFKKNEVLIGRGATCDYNIFDEKISRSHAIFKRSGSIWTVKNLSINGVLVNEDALPLGEEIVIDIGSTVQIGQPKQFVFRFGKKELGSRKKKLQQDEKSNLDGGKLTSEQEALEQRLRESEVVQGKLIKEKEQLQCSLRDERQQLQQRFSKEQEELEKRHREGVLAQQSLLQEKELLAQQLHRQVEEIQQKMQEEKFNLEQKLEKEERIKRSILEEKEEIANKLRTEKEALERRLLEERRILEEKLLTELQQVQNQLSSLEEKKLQLEEEVQNKEQSLRQKEEQRRQMEEEQLKTAKQLQAEKEELLTQLKDFENNLEEKVLLTSTLAGELLEKQQVHKRLDALMVDKLSLELQLQEAAKKEEKVSNLQDALGLLEAQKLSLEQEIAFAASCSEHARKEVVDTVSNVVENEFQCPICNELFITAIMLNCSHTFCKFCIDSWKKNKRDCPNCRTSITSETRSIVVDNFIEKIVETLSEDMKMQRQQMIKERAVTIEAAKRAEAAAAAAKKAEQDAAAAARAANQSNRRGRSNRGARRGGRGGRANTRPTRATPSSTTAPNTTDMPVILPNPPAMEVIVVPDNNNDSNNEESAMAISSDSEEESMVSSSSMSGDEGVYFGGYGRCFNCGRRGHWANGCPDNW